LQASVAEMKSFGVAGMARSYGDRGILVRPMP